MADHWVPAELPWCKAREAPEPQLRNWTPLRKNTSRLSLCKTGSYKMVEKKGGLTRIQSEAPKVSRTQPHYTHTFLNIVPKAQYLINEEYFY
jgi:hypothetical protein